MIITNINLSKCKRYIYSRITEQQHRPTGALFKYSLSESNYCRMGGTTSQILLNFQTRVAEQRFFYLKIYTFCP